MASYFDDFFQKGWHFSEESDLSCSYIKLQRFNNIHRYLEIIFHCNLKITNKNGEIIHCTYQCNRENNIKRHILTNKHKCRKPYIVVDKISGDFCLKQPLLTSYLILHQNHHPSIKVNILDEFFY